MKKIAVILSGCGVYDGSEIYETVCTLLAIEQAGASYECLAPDVLQRRVINHITQKEQPGESRNVLVEAARLARGNIKAMAKAKPDDYDGMIFPGGFGAALNLSDFGINGDKSHIEPEVLQFAKAIANQQKPSGFICIAPNLIAHIYGKGIQVTIGDDENTAKILEKMGCKHITCTVENIIVDKENKVVTTPAYMLGKSISEVFLGIQKLVKEVIKMA